MPLTTEQTRTAEMVESRYAANPDLLIRLIERLGGRDISVHGDYLQCTCPLHQGDNTKALCVRWNGGFVSWTCYTRCGRGGRLTYFVKKRLGCTWGTALAFIAAPVGIDVGSMAHIEIGDEQLDAEEAAAFERRMALFSQQQVPQIFAESWVEQSLNYWSHPNALAAWDFLTGPLNTLTPAGEKRKQFPPEVLQIYQVGFVPARTWVVPNPKKPGKLTGWFCDRICIPWRNLEGQCIGFAGRRFDGIDHSKYETFTGTRKSLAMYGLWNEFARREIARTHKVILVEGYGDVWRAWCHGIYNVISPGGTELSRTQIDCLHGLAVEEVVLFYDSDEAGVLVSRRMADQLRSEMKVACAVPPPGYDPGDLLEREQYVAPILQARVVY